MNYRAAILLLCMAGCNHAQQNKDILFQTSTINALLAGIYDGGTTCKELKLHGDFGLGTFNGLDGEMIVLDNEIYQAKADGMIYKVDENTKTPFASVTYFEPDQTFPLEKKTDMEKIKQYIDNHIPSKNIFYAIQIKANFDFIRVRSVPKQAKSYHPLIEVTKTQPEYSFENTEGTILGFRCPEYVAGINVPKYHFHFINKDKTRGGHVLDVVMSHANIQIDNTYTLVMQLPEQNDFYNLDLTKEKKKEMENVEN